MPILRLPVELLKPPARLQLREQGGAFLGTQELGEDVPDLRSGDRLPRPGIPLASPPLAATCIRLI